MTADRVEVSRDASQNDWLIRIQVGEEVIRRHCDEPKDANPDTLRKLAAGIAAEEGYEIEPSGVVLSLRT